jgi:putative phage-type endonuclease
MSKKIILEKDVLETINDFDAEIYEKVKMDESCLELQEIINGQLFEYYEVNDLDDQSILTVSKRKYLQEIVEQKLDQKIDSLRDRLFQMESIKEKVENLKRLELPEQRSKEWFEMRSNILTASSLADALGKGHFNTREGLLIDKTSKEEKPFFTNDIIQWGVKYEPTATTFYENINHLKIIELGLVPHPEFKIFGASPDGICDIDSPQYYAGRMLEIKCPPIRKFTEEVPEHYWMQMQGQLETCDLVECDFLQVKVIEYSSEEEYQNDKFLMYDNNEKIGYASTGYPKGLVLTFLSKNEKGNTVYEYEYAEFYQTFEQLKEWSSTIIEQEKYKNKECKFNWWKIQRYECTLVGRDRQWWLETMPKIIDFWDDVEHYRKIGNQELIDKKEARKQKRKKNPKKKSSPKYNIVQIDKKVVDSVYLLDSDSD